MTTAEQLAELARSGASPDVKYQILVAMLTAAHQASEADLRLRLHNAERELVKLRRQLAESAALVGKLQGDVRVRDATITHLREHWNRAAFLWFVSSALLGIGGAFIGRSWPASIVSFVTGIVLFVFSWRQGPSKIEGPK